MAGELDSTVPHIWYGDGAIDITDGSGNTVTAGVKFVQEASWTQTSPPFTESKNRNKRLATPVAMQTGDGECELSMTFQVTSLKGSTIVYPYDAFTQTGTASAWTSVIDGDKYAIQIDVTYDSTAGSQGGSGGGPQKVRFPYCITTSVSASHVDGILTIECSFAVLADGPTIL